MSVDWDAYEPYERGDRPYDELSREEARSAYEQLMAAKQERIDMLRRLLAANGLKLGNDEEQLRQLDRWFRDNVERDPDDTRLPSPQWLSVSTDIGLFLGEAIIDREPGVKWKLLEGASRDMNNRRPVLTGFDPAYDVDVLRLVYDYAFRIIQGSGRNEKDTLPRIVSG